MGFSIGLLQLEVISAAEQGAADSLPVDPQQLLGVEQLSSLPRADGVQAPRAPVFVLFALPDQAVPVLCAVLEFVGWELILSQDSEGSDPPPEPGSVQRQQRTHTHTVLLLYIYLSGLGFFHSPDQVLILVLIHSLLLCNPI